MSEGPAIGIDLGTSYSRVGVFQNGKVEIIAKIPSVIKFMDSEVIIGEVGPGREEDQNHSNTISNVKRLIGRKFHDPTAQSEMKYWPFNVVEDEETGKAKVIVAYKGEMKSLFPEEILTKLLAKLKEVAGVHLGKVITDAVVTVPTQLTYMQRRIIQEACWNIGLRVLRLMNEPDAAAVAYYGLDPEQRDSERVKDVLIVNFGGGYLDVSIIDI